MKNVSRTSWWALAGALALGLVLRLVKIGTEPFWNDELLSYDIVRTFDVRTMVSYLRAVEYHPPLYYIMLKGWMAAFGEGEAAARLLSTLFSLGTVALAWVLGHRLFRDGRVAGVAAFLTATLPLQIEYGQEARPYALMAFFAGLAFWAMWERRRGGKAYWSVLYAVSGATGMYLHYSFALFLFATGIWWTVDALFSEKGKRVSGFTEAVVVHACVVLTFFPWLDTLFYKIELGKLPIGGRLSEVPGIRKTVFFEDMLHGLFWTSKSIIASKIEILASFAAKLGIFAASLFAFRTWKKDLKGPVSAIVFVSTLTVVAFFLSPQSVGYTDLPERHLLTVLMPFTLVLAWILTRLPAKKSAAVLALFAVSLLPNIVTILDDDSKVDRHFRYEDEGEYISANRMDGDIVIVAAAGVRTSLSHYLPDDLPMESYWPLWYFGNDEWAGRHVLGVVENDSQVRGIEIANSISRQVEMQQEKSAGKEKIGRAIERHGAKRVWLFGFSPGADARGWFEENGWRHAVRGKSELSRTDLYVAPAEGL